MRIKDRFFSFIDNTLKVSNILNMHDVRVIRLEKIVFMIYSYCSNIPVIHAFKNIIQFSHLDLVQKSNVNTTQVVLKHNYKVGTWIAVIYNNNWQRGVIREIANHSNRLKIQFMAYKDFEDIPSEISSEILCVISREPYVKAPGSEQQLYRLANDDFRKAQSFFCRDEYVISKCFGR